MSRTARTYRLADQVGPGLSCDEAGLFLGETPLLARDSGQGWQPRPLADGTASYGLPVDFTGKLAGLRGVATALTRGDVALAKIAALQLRLPDPPPLSKGSLAAEALIELAYALQASDLLAKEFDSDKHPRWPAGAPDHQGGQFAPSGAAGAPQAAPAPAAKKPKGRQEKADSASPLATSLHRKPQKLSPQAKALLDTLEAKLKDPSNQGVVTFDNRDDALKDMGYFFSADITRYDDSRNQVERGAWLLYDPQTGLWSYDRSQMRVGTQNASRVSLPWDAATFAAYQAGDAVGVHIHPLIDESNPNELNAVQNNLDNQTFSKPSHEGPGDAGSFAAISKEHATPLHAAVIGSDGSISYADGGADITDYEGKKVDRIAPRGTIPMLVPGH